MNNQNKITGMSSDFGLNPDEIARRFKSVRVESGLTQSQFGDKLSVSQDTVSLWETGKSIPAAEYIVAICKMFSVSADYLLGLTEY